MNASDRMIVLADTAPLAPVRVRRAADADGAAWMQYALAHSQTVLGHHWGWRHVLCEVHDLKPFYLIAERGGRVCGIMPLVEVKSLLFGHALVSLPFMASAGPIADDTQSIDALLSEATRTADRLNVSHLEVRNADRLKTDWAEQDLYVLFRRDLAPDDETNLQRIPRKQRAMVRKGIANNLTSTSTDAKTMHALYSDNVHRHGTPAHSRRYFETCQQVFGDELEFLLVCDPSGKGVSSVMSLYWKGAVYPFHAGDYVEARKLAANDFKYWELMRRAVARGCDAFDYGRSKRGTGPYDFKRNWGFEPVPLHYQYVLRTIDTVPENNPLNPRFKLMIETWRRMPRWVVNAAGPRLIRTLG